MFDTMVVSSADTDETSAAVEPPWDPPSDSDWRAGFREQRADEPVYSPAHAAPSGWLALEIDAATGEDGARLDETELVDAVVALEHLTAWAGARQARLLAEFTRRRTGGAAGRYGADEVALALAQSCFAAKARVGQSVQLTETLTATLTAWERGHIDGPKVRAICEATLNLAPHVAVAIQDRVLPRAGGQSLPQLKASLKRAVIAADPAGAAQRYQKARAERRVCVGDENDGMASIWALLPAQVATASHQWLTRLARSLGREDPRGMDARRADLMGELLTGNLTVVADTPVPVTVTVTDCTVSDCTAPHRAAPAHRASTDSAPAPAYRASTDSASAPAYRASTDNASPMTPTASTDNASSGNASSGNASSGNASSGNASGGSAATDSAATDSAATDSAATDSAATDSAATDSAATDSAATDSAATDSAATGDAATDSGSTGGAVTGDAVTGDAPTGGAVTDGASAVPAAAPAGALYRLRPVTPGKPLVQIVMPYSTLRGADEQPCELVGFGPIPADLAREIAADAVWSRLVIDPLSGALLDHARTTYRPPAALTDFVKARDVHCRFPVCRRRAQDCELDHTIPFPEGPTAHDNLYNGCARHHHLKHDAGWTVTQHPDGRISWITPTGHRYTSDPHDYRPEPEPPPRPTPPPAPPPVPRPTPVPLVDPWGPVTDRPDDDGEPPPF